MKKIKSKLPLVYIDHFGLADEDLHKILNIALSQGGDFSEIYLVNAVMPAGQDKGL